VECANVEFCILFEGSKVDVLNKNAESPLHLAIRMMHADIVELLVNYGELLNVHCCLCLYPLNTFRFIGYSVESETLV